jgi:hypothetical protein
MTAATALAYPSESATYPDGVARTACIDCHGLTEQGVLESSSESTPTANTRKGPHGAYTTGTNKCQACHSVHAAPVGGANMLPGATIKATCESCHDGTGGTGVYGVIKARTGVEPAATHSIETTNAIPGGSVDSTTSAGVFAGPGGTLTCSDCHSPHDSETVEPFLGDRLRSSVESDTAYAVRTNRLLKQSPGSSETTVGVYGTAWCASCHQGRAAQHSADSGLMSEHVVENDLLAPEGDAYYYDRLPVVASVGSTETTIGALGQSNAGYVMPQESLETTGRAELQQGRGPICQQCHEDARDVGPVGRGTSPTLLAGQEFSVTSYASEAVTTTPGVESTDNPRFQVFPHESDAAYFLVREYEPEPVEYALCLNCHSLKHDVPEEYVECVTCHAPLLGLAGGDAIDMHMNAEDPCYVCHGSAEPLTFDCGTCHAEQLEPHGYEVEDHLATLGSGFVVLYEAEGGHDPGLTQDEGPWGSNVQCGMCHTAEVGPVHAYRCGTCHPTPRDTFTTWNRSCQDGGCHVTFHEESDPAHRTVEEDCANCHQGGNPGGPIAADYCLRCHAPADAAIATVTDAQSAYIGPARIGLKLEDSMARIALGTVFYRLNGGSVESSRTVFVEQPGSHTLEFWSLDQNGNLETPSQTATFTVEADVDPPATTTNIVPDKAYYTTQNFTLTATDNGTLGVKSTYYELKLNGTLVQEGTGTRVTVSPPANGTAEYTLEYWSEDWSGNVEMRQAVSFSMVGGTGTLSFWFGGTPAPGSLLDVTIYRNGWGTQHRIGQWSFGGATPLQEYENVTVPVSDLPYYAYVAYYDAGSDWEDEYFWDGSSGSPKPIYLLVPNEIIVLPY